MKVIKSVIIHYVEFRCIERNIFESGNFYKFSGNDSFHLFTREITAVLWGGRKYDSQKTPYASEASERNKAEQNCVTAVSDFTRPALSKTFQDFGYFFDVNQPVTIESNACLSNIASRSSKIKSRRERTDSFSPSHSVFLLDLEALWEQFHFGNLNLPCFSKKVTKKIRAKT